MCDSLVQASQEKEEKEIVGRIGIPLPYIVGSPLNSGTKRHCMEFNWPLGFSKLFPKNILARFTSSFVAFSLLLAILPVSLAPFDSFLFSSFDLRVLDRHPLSVDPKRDL